MRHQNATLAVAVGALLLTGLLYYAVPTGFFPTQDTGIIQGISQAAGAVSYPQMAREQQALARRILSDPAVQDLTSFIGPDGTNTTLNSGRIEIDLKPIGQRDGAAAVIRRLVSHLAQVRGIRLYMQPVQDITVDDRVSRTQYQYTLEDPSEQELTDVVAGLLPRLQQLPQLDDVVSDQQNDGLAVSLRIDRATAARFGVNPETIDATLYDAFGQRQINTMYTQSNQYHVILETDPRFKSGPGELDDIYIQSAGTSGTAGSAGSAAPTTAGSSSGAGAGVQASAGNALLSPGTASGGASLPVPVPIGAFTQAQIQSEALAINHQEQFPAVTLSFNLHAGYSLGQALEAIDRVVAGAKLPPGVIAGYQGTAAAFQGSLGNEGLLLLAAIATVYIVLGVLYESFIHPITILSTLPSAGVGALLALLLFGLDLNIVSIIGIILLIGIVQKNGIMMVDFALEAERKQGKPPAEAVIEAARLRFRPIVMTTLAALLSGLPLAFGSGMGSELRRPLGVAIVGGLLISQVLTLYTTPVIYLFFDRLAVRWSRPQLDPDPDPNPNPNPA